MNTFFRYTSAGDKALMVIGSLAAVFTGFLMPGLAILIGLITGTFDPDNSPDEIYNQMSILAGVIVLIGVVTWITSYIYYGFWQHLAENVSFDLRSRYLRAVLRQEVAYFEINNVE